jgi:hypothetical protein
MVGFWAAQLKAGRVRYVRRFQHAYYSYRKKITMLEFRGLMDRWSDV